MLPTKTRCESSLQRASYVRPSALLGGGDALHQEQEATNSMANQQQLNLLKQGITETWNRWRENHPDSALKLSKVDLREAQLGSANLAHTDLSGADLSEADLNNANLSGANLANAQLYRADLTGASLIDAYLSGADLTEANLHDAHMHGVHLRWATLHDTRITPEQLNEARSFQPSL